MTETERKWRERVRGWRESGQTAKAFSANHGFSAGTLSYWVCELKKRGIETVAVHPGTAAEKTEVRDGLRVLRVEGVQKVVQKPATLTVEIGAARLHVPLGADKTMLRATIDALVAAQGSIR